MEFYTLHFDGACAVHTNKTAGIGFILKHNGEVIESLSDRLIGDYTNNAAEYISLNKGLESFIKLGASNSYLQVKGDSQLVIQQMNQKWKIKNGLYATYAYKAKELTKLIRKHGNQVSFDWVRRDLNAEADKLSKLYLQ